MLKYVSVLTGWSSRVADRSLLATDSMSWENIRILNQGAQETNDARDARQSQEYHGTQDAVVASVSRGMRVKGRTQNIAIKYPILP